MNVFFGQRCSFDFENLLLVEPVQSGYGLHFLDYRSGSVQVEYECEHLWVEFMWSLTKTIPDDSRRYKAVECFQTYPDGWDGDYNLLMTRVHDIIGWKEIEQYKLPVTKHEFEGTDSIRWLPNFGLMDTDTGMVSHIKTGKQFETLEDYQEWVRGQFTMTKT